MENRSKITLWVVGAVFAVTVALAWFLPATPYSPSERRPLAKAPQVSIEAILSGKFMSDFETFSQDQFPARESLRKVKAVVAVYALRQTTSHGIYVVEWTAAKVEYPYKPAELAYATSRFTYVWETFGKPAGCTAYAALVPDKAYFLSEANGFPAMDYAALTEDYKAALSWATYIDLFPTLELDDYYNTDPHWRHERLGDTAAVLAAGMGHTLTWDPVIHVATDSFLGTYAGQSALPMDSDTLCYTTCPQLDACTAFNVETGQPAPIFDLSRADGRDPYEVYLQGPVSLITITNPALTDGSHLIIFRDSFGSSIAPWLAEAYAEITLVDIRYMSPNFLDRFVDFTGADLLFLFGTTVLNNSAVFK